MTVSGISHIESGVRRRLASARVGHLATSSRSQPAVVPVCFALIGETIYQAIDAKPKRVPAERLRRVRNIRANPRVAVLVDHYEEDWRKLWFVLLEGRARLLRSGREHQRAIAALTRKYRQYRRMPLADDALVLAIDVDRHSHWQSS